MTRGMFRLLLISTGVLGVFSAVLHVLLFKHAPVDLQTSFRAYAYASHATRLGHVKLLIELLSVILSLVLIVGVFFFKKWAWKLYLPFTILYLLLVGFTSRAFLQLGWEIPVMDAVGMISGIILMAMYTEPLKSEFGKKKAA